MSAIETCLWPTRCTPVALGFKGQNGARSWGAKTQGCSIWVRKFGDAASESSTLWYATGPVSM